MLDFILKYWIEILFGLLISFLTYLFNLVKNYKKKIEATNKGIAMILKYKIIETYNKFINRESISIDDKDTLNELYSVYSTFECCDVVQDLMEKINRIPIK